MHMKNIQVGIGAVNRIMSAAGSATQPYDLTKIVTRRKSAAGHARNTGTYGYATSAWITEILNLL